MKIKCKQHGITYTVALSSDLEVNVHKNEQIEEYIIVHYQYENSIEMTFYLSAKYVLQYNLHHEDVLPLPKTYPEWFMNLGIVCEKCLEDCLVYSS